MLFTEKNIYTLFICSNLQEIQQEKSGRNPFTKYMSYIPSQYAYF